MKPSCSTYTPEIAEEISAHLARGLSLRTIGTLSGMPDRATLTRWLKLHPEFARRCEAAGFEQAERHREESCVEICAHIAEGRPIAEICAMPGLPSLRTVSEWRRAFPEFAQKLRAARQQHEDHLQETVCRHFRQGGDAATLGTTAGLPSLRTVQAWLIENSDFAERFRKAGGPAELIPPPAPAPRLRPGFLDALADEILAIADDESLDLATRRTRASIRLSLLRHWTQERNLRQPEPPVPVHDPVAQAFSRIRAGQPLSDEDQHALNNIQRTPK